MAYRAAARSLTIAGFLVWTCSQIAQAGVNVWTTHGPEIGYVFSVVVDPVHSGTVYAAGTSLGVFKSVDGGKTWTNRSTGLGANFISSLALAPDGTTIYAATGAAGIFKSVDAGEHWYPSNAGMTSDYVTALAVDPFDPETVYAGKDEGHEYSVCAGSCFSKTTDAGRNWRGIPTVPFDPDIEALTVDPSTPGTLYAVYYEYYGSGVMKSTDGGETWKTLDTGSPIVYAVALDPSSPATLYAGTYDGLIKSTDSGVSWRRLPLYSGLSGLYVSSVAVDPGGSGTVYAVFGAAVFRSRDGGETWASLSAGLGGSNVYGLVIDPADPSRLFAASVNGVLLEYQVAEPCAPGPASLCLSGGRFEVSARWSSSGGGSGTGRAEAISGVAGYFTFFGASNVELLVKVVEGCGVNGHFWTFAGGLTNLGVVLTVRDTQTGAVKVYRNPPNSPFETIQDTAAFPCSSSALSAARAAASATVVAPPSPIASDRVLETTSRQTATCVADGVSLCLNDARYRVTARWTAPDGSTGDARPLTLTADAGAFWFFTPENPELVVKVLDGCAVNSRGWVFAAGLTNVEVVLTVTDTQTGLVRLYVNRQGTPFQPIQDTDAFTTCP